MDKLKLPSAMLGLLIAPARTLAVLRTQASPWLGFQAVALTGAAWSGFSWLLHAGAQSPSAVLLPIEPERYYLWQAVFVGPVLLGLWLLTVLVSHALSRLGGSTTAFRHGLAPIGIAYAVPLLVAFVVPELLAYLSFGVEALRLVARFTGSALALITWAYVALAVRSVHRSSWPRSIFVSGIALILQAATGALVLR